MICVRYRAFPEVARAAGPCRCEHAYEYKDESYKGALGENACTYIPQSQISANMRSFLLTFTLVATIVGALALPAQREFTHPPNTCMVCMTCALAPEDDVNYFFADGGSITSVDKPGSIC